MSENHFDLVGKLVDCLLKETTPKASEKDENLIRGFFSVRTAKNDAVAAKMLKCIHDYGGHTDRASELEMNAMLSLMMSFTGGVLPRDDGESMVQAMAETTVNDSAANDSADSKIHTNVATGYELFDNNAPAYEAPTNKAPTSEASANEVPTDKTLTNEASTNEAHANQTPASGASVLVSVDELSTVMSPTLSAAQEKDQIQVPNGVAEGSHTGDVAVADADVGNDSAKQYPGNHHLSKELTSPATPEQPRRLLPHQWRKPIPLEELLRMVNASNSSAHVRPDAPVNGDGGDAVLSGGTWQAKTPPKSTNGSPKKSSPTPSESASLVEVNHMHQW